MNAEIDANKNIRLTSHHCPLSYTTIKSYNKVSDSFSARERRATRDRQREEVHGCTLCDVKCKDITAKIGCKVDIYRIPAATN